MITILASIPIIFILAYLSVRNYIPEWNEPDRGFRFFKDDWGKIFLGAGAFATLLSLLLEVATDANIITSIAVGAISGLLLIGSYTDSLVTKVPGEISSMVIKFSFALGFAALISNALENPQIKFFETFYIYSWGQDPYIWILGGIGVCFIGFLLWMRMNNIIGMLAICLSAAGLFISIYMTLEWIVQSFFISDAFWSYFFRHGLASMFAFVLLVVALELAAGSKLGGADSQALYAIGWGFAAIVGQTVLALGLIVACFVQLLLHFVAKPLKIGHEKEVQNSSFRQARINKKWLGEGAAPTTRKVWAVPFLPVMNISIIATVVTAIFIAS